MTIKEVEDFFFEVKEILNPEAEKRLIINCSDCPFVSSTNLEEKCISCFLNILFLNQDKLIKTVLVKKTNTIIKFEKLKFLFDYFKILNSLKKDFSKLKSKLNKLCIFSEFYCDLKSYLSVLLKNTKKDAFLNPISLFTHLKLISQESTLVSDGNEYCVKCRNVWFEKLSNLVNILQSLDIIKLYCESKVNYYDFTDYVIFFNTFFFEKPPIEKENQYLEESLKNELIDEYLIGSTKSFKARIYKMINVYEKKYVIDFAIKSDIDKDYLLRIINDIKNNLKPLDLPDIIPLEELIKKYMQNARFYLNSKYQNLNLGSEKISFISALKILNLDKLFPLLEDDFIEEIFLDSPCDKIYLNHQKWGRCRTEIAFSESEIERLKTFLRIYSGKRLDFTNPDIKVVIKNEYFNCRFSVDIEPIQVDKFALDIRKLNKNILNIQDLLKNDTLNSTIAAFLYFLILNRINITCTGETDTGKTTLINALDILTPREYRKIYVENVIESLNQSKYGKHQLKYQVDSLQEKQYTYSSKNNQIKNLLHRSPDIIYLGEILTKEEAKAMFHCLSAGLKGFQTIHSNSTKSLINRLLFHFKINFSCLSDLGVIIFMKKSRYKRFISSISEINCEEKNLNKILRNIFLYDPKYRSWKSMENLFQLEVIRIIKESIFINEDDFNLLINLYIKIFETLKQINKIDNYELIVFFDILAHKSYQGINESTSFWENWKKSRGLN